MIKIMDLKTFLALVCLLRSLSTPNALENNAMFTDLGGLSSFGVKILPWGTNGVFRKAGVSSLQLRASSFQMQPMTTTPYPTSIVNGVAMTLYPTTIGPGGIPYTLAPAGGAAGAVAAAQAAAAAQATQAMQAAGAMQAAQATAAAASTTTGKPWPPTTTTTMEPTTTPEPTTTTTPKPTTPEPTTTPETTVPQWTTLIPLEMPERNLRKFTDAIGKNLQDSMKGFGQFVDGTFKHIDGRLDASEGGIANHELRIRDTEHKSKSNADELKVVNGRLDEQKGRLDASEDAISNHELRVRDSEDSLSNHELRIRALEEKLAAATRGLK